MLNQWVLEDTLKYKFQLSGAHSRHRECQELRRCLCNLFGLIADLQELSAIQNSICLRMPKRGWILTQILWRFSKLLPCLWPRLLIQTSWQDLCVLQFCVCHLSHAQRPRWEFRDVWIPSGTQGWALLSPEQLDVDLAELGHPNCSYRFQMVVREMMK